MTNNWPLNEPDSLEDLCVQQCVATIQTLAEKTDSNEYKLKPDVFLLVPSLCDKLFKHFQASKPPDSYEWMHIFDDTDKSRLCSVNLFRALDERHILSPSIIRKCIKICLKHPLKQLDFVDCLFSYNIFELIISSKARHTLLSLCIEGEHFADDALTTYFESLNLKVGDRIPDIYLDCPQLQRLVLRDVKKHNLALLPGCDIVHLFPQLTHLDLSRCFLSTLALTSLTKCDKLTWLNLNCVEFERHEMFINSICKITNLRHLDISSDISIIQANYPNNVEQMLRTLLLHLRHLVSLDISGTNLAGRDRTVKSFKLEAKGAGDCNETEVCPIPGLEGRYFEFLGLYNCPFESFNRENIPAKQVTGSKNEEQLLFSLRRYVDRRDDVSNILNLLFVLFKEETVVNQAVALEGILAAMKRHPTDKHVQISGSASLFYIMKGEQKAFIPQKIKRVVINCLLDGMEDLDADHVMIRNCCLTLCHLSMPQDVLFCYKRLISVLLRLNQDEGQEDFVQRITLYMINHLACQVDGEEKKMVGDLGAIKIMLKTIEKRLGEFICDEIMEMSWSTMWNVTDETAINCDRFMEGGGMALFIKCLQTFPDKPELLRNMMGLMGNIAEVPHLRPKLMEKSFIRIFCDLLDSEKDGIEVSYNSAGVFSHMMADGAEAWKVLSPDRDEVTEKLISAIQRWPLTSTRNINYRSFAPILKLVDAYHALGAQYWSVWALCNLTTVYPQKYCSLLKREGGEEYLNKILLSPETIPEIKDLAMKTLKNINKDTESAEENSIEDQDSVESSEED